MELGTTCVVTSLHVIKRIACRSRKNKHTRRYSSILGANLLTIFHSKRKAVEWMETPCAYLWGMTPKEVCDMGLEGEVLEVLKENFAYMINYD